MQPTLNVLYSICCFVYQLAYVCIITMCLPRNFKDAISKIQVTFYRDVWFSTVYSPVGKYIVLNHENQYKRFLNFSSYDYLGINEWRYTPTTLAENEPQRLVEKLKAFTGYTCIALSSTGYSANATYLRAIIPKGYVALCDRHIHNSSIRGLQGIPKRIFEHNDMDALERLLQRHDRAFVIIEGLYSMHGHSSPVDKIIQLKEKYHFKLIVDEAHSFGCMGANGLGSFDNPTKYVDYYIATFSKTCNGSGGFIASYQTIDSLETIHPRTCQHISKVIDFVASEDGRLALTYLRDLSQTCHQMMVDAGLEIISDAHSPVKCVKMGLLYDGPRFIRYARTHGFALTAVTGGVVSKFGSIVRVCLSTYHTLEDIRQLMMLFTRTSTRAPETVHVVKTLDDYRDIDALLSDYGVGTSGPPAFYGSLHLIHEIERRMATARGREGGIFLTHSEHGLSQLLKYAENGACGPSMTYEKLDGTLLVMADRHAIAYAKFNLDQYTYSATLPMYVYYDIYKCDTKRK
jgi:7-keto-8-aminopelargonate synthetase-like enzyme